MHYALKKGELAQLARAPALHAGGQGFESLILHKKKFIDILDKISKIKTSRYKN